MMNCRPLNIAITLAIVPEWAFTLLCGLPKSLTRGSNIVSPQFPSFQGQFCINPINTFK